MGCWAWRPCSAQGGFSFQIAQIGMLLSSAGVFMILFTLLVLPWFTRRSKRWMNQVGTLSNVPLSLLWPVLAVANHHYELAHGHRSLPSLWPCLIGVYILKNISVNVAFTGMIIQVNHSVQPEDLGKVNGLGQSFVSAARALGPALGGCLWSLSVHSHFVFLNFLLVAALYLCSERLNGSLPLRLDHQKTPRTAQLSSSHLIRGHNLPCHS
jgi:MFS family permease